MGSLDLVIPVIDAKPSVLSACRNSFDSCSISLLLMVVTVLMMTGMMRLREIMNGHPDPHHAVDPGVDQLDDETLLNHDTCLA
jgi:hypothetical protein